VSFHASDSHLNHGPNFSGSSLSIPDLRNGFGKCLVNAMNRTINNGNPIENNATASSNLNIKRHIPAIRNDQHPAPIAEAKQTAKQIWNVAYNLRQFIFYLLFAEHR
jgi:hypothetical protein